MYLYAHYSNAQAAYDALESMYAEGEVSPCEVAAVKPLPRKRGSKSPTRIGIYLKTY
jgi:hypothetical protein